MHLLVGLYDAFFWEALLQLDYCGGFAKLDLIVDKILGVVGQPPYY